MKVCSENYTKHIITQCNKIQNFLMLHFMAHAVVARLQNVEVMNIKCDSNKEEQYVSTSGVASRQGAMRCKKHTQKLTSHPFLLPPLDIFLS